MSNDELNGEGDCIVKLDGQLILDWGGQVVRLGRITSIGVFDFLGSVSRVCMNDGSATYEPDGDVEATIKITCDVSAVDRPAAAAAAAAAPAAAPAAPAPAPAAPAPAAPAAAPPPAGYGRK